MVAAVALLVPACSVAHAADVARGARPLPPITPERPNVILVLADDVDVHAFDRLPQIQRRVLGQGLRFTNAFSGTPLSAAARATLLTGDRARDHRNWTTYGASGGGAAGFERRGGFERTLATYLPEEYFTGYFGKVMPGYGTHGHQPVTPRGWDRWFGLIGGGYHGSTAWQNGKRVQIDDWFIDAIEHRVTRAIVEEPDPLFLVVAPFNVHDEVDLMDRHARAFPAAHYPRTRALSLAPDALRDKPRWVRELADGTDLTEVDATYRERLRAALPIDELVASIVDALRAQDRLRDTYLLVASDNGFRHNEFGIGFGKNDPYEPSQRIPFAIRGPGIAAGSVNPHLASFVDLPATLLALTGTAIPASFDGVSLIPAFDAGTAVRDVHVIEGLRGGDDNLTDWSERANPVRYRGFRTADEKYVETRNRDGSMTFEFYDLVVDPAETTNRYTSLSVERRVELSTRLASLMTTAV